MSKEFIIGYDVREMWLDNSALWSKNRKKQYLLKMNVAKPLSVDSTVWTSVFDIEHRVEGMPWENVDRRTEYCTNEWDTIFAQHAVLPRQNYYLWHNLDDMKSILNQTWGEMWKPCCVVAITEILDEDSDWYGKGMVEPAEIQADWKLLGYEILAGSSFVMNAGYFDNERRKLQQRLIPYLNNHHLFSTLHGAMRCFDTVEAREPRHGPFVINGLYLIQSINTRQVLGD